MTNVLFLSETDVDRLIDLPTVIEVVEEAFRRLAAGEAVNVPRERVVVPGLVLHTMSAAATYAGYAGYKAYSTTRTAARFHVGLYELATGRLAALIEANRLGQLRTAATTAVAVRCLAPPDVTEMGLFGCGYQAEMQLAAVRAVRPLQRAFVYSRNPQKRAEFAERMAVRLGIDVEAVDRPQAAAEDLPLVVTATTSAEPVFDGHDLAQRALVCAVGSNWRNRAEVDSTVVRRADRIVCDDVAACRHEAGDFADALEKGMFDWGRAVNLADVLAGKAPGRSHATDLTLFKSVGLALEDVAVAARLVETARRMSIGTSLPI